MRESTFRSTEVTSLSQKKSNGTPIQSKPQTPTGISRPGTSGSLPSSKKPTSQKYDSPKAIVMAMRIVGHWAVADYKNGILLKGQGSEVERTNGRAEFALFLKIIPLPGSTLEVLHLNKNIHLKLGSYRAIPLLPDGSCPREAAGPTALGIPIVSGRYHRSTGGKVKLHRRQTSECSTQESLANVDGLDENDGENSDDSGDTISSSIAAILGPEMFSDGPCDAIDSGSKGDVLSTERVNDADKWLESYHSGTRLTENTSGHLCIGFDESVRRDPLVVEIYFEFEPIQPDESLPEESSFILAGLPYCKKGIAVSLQVESSSTDYEWVFDTKPTLSDALELGENWLCGTFYTGKTISDNTLIIRSHKILRLQEPKGFTVELTTQVSPIPNLDTGNVDIIYSVKIVLNGTQPLEPDRRSTLSFKVYNVHPDDKWDLQDDTAELDDYSEDCTNLEILRPASQTYQDIILTIVGQRNLKALAKIQVPRFVSTGGFLVAETVLLEELGDQPIAYVGIEDVAPWTKVENEGDSKIWTRTYRLPNNLSSVFTFGLVMNPSGFPLPGKEIEAESRNDVVDIVSYTVHPISDVEVTKGHVLFQVQMAIQYETNSLSHNERVFTITSGKWNHERTFFNGSYADGIFQACNDDRSVWIVLNNDYGRRGGSVLMESSWIGVGEEVFLTQNGEVVHSEESNQGDRYVFLEVPYVMDKWVHVDCNVDWENYDVESAWLGTQIPPRTSSLPSHRPHTPISRSDKGHLPYSPSGVHENCFSPSKSPGGTKARTLVRRNHINRGVMKGEIHRDEQIYLTQKGPRVFVYISYAEQLSSKNVGEDQLSPAEEKATKKMHHHQDHPQQAREIPVKVGKEKSGAVGGGADMTWSSGLSYSQHIGPRVITPAQEEMDISVESLKASELTIAPTSATTSSDGLNRNHKPILVEKRNTISNTRHRAEHLRGHHIHSKTKTSRGSKDEAPNNLVLDSTFSTGGVVLRCLSYILYIMGTLLAVIVILEMSRYIQDTREEIHQVRKEMKRFQSVFESVYGVSFGDARWRRVRIHQDGDLVVLVRGKSIEEPFERLLSSHTVDIDRDAFWVEHKGFQDKDSDFGQSMDSGDNDYLFRKKHTQGYENSHKKQPVEGSEEGGGEEADSMHFGVDDDADYTSAHKDAAAKIQDLRKPKIDNSVAMATWDSRDKRLYPWEHMREVITYALEKYEGLTEDAKQTMKYSWNKFLRAWRNVWYMT